MTDWVSGGLGVLLRTRMGGKSENSECSSDGNWSWAVGGGWGMGRWGSMVETARNPSLICCWGCCAGGYCATVGWSKVEYTSKQVISRLGLLPAQCGAKDPYYAERNLLFASGRCKSPFDGIVSGARPNQCRRPDRWGMRECQCFRHKRICHPVRLNRKLNSFGWRIKSVTTNLGNLIIKGVA